MHHEDIKALIRKTGSSPAAIARSLDVSSATVSNVIKGNTVSARIAGRISTVTGKRFSELWPGKYRAFEFAEALQAAHAAAPVAAKAVKPAAAARARRTAA